MKFSVAEARALLEAAGVFFDRDGEMPDQALNLNDVWGWACADLEVVADEELPGLADLFWSYGHCGILYWVSRKRNGQRSEFKDINRFIDFAKAEENIREGLPDSSQRAYAHYEYTIGAS